MKSTGFNALFMMDFLGLFFLSLVNITLVQGKDS